MDPDFEECHSPYESVYSGATGDIRGNHCYDSYYAVYSENDQEYFADDNPLSALNIEESRRLDFSGDLGNKIKQSADDAEGGMFDSKISTGTPLEEMIMECCKNGTDVDVNKLEASDARWYQLYVDQKQLAAKVNSGTGTGTVTPEPRIKKSIMSPPEFSGENPLNTSDDKTWKERASLASNTDIRIRLKETLKELALFQSKVAVLEAEKLLHPPQDYSTPTSAIKDSSCRLYLPEMEPKDINNACSGMNSEYAEINISIFDAVNSGDTESLCDILLYNPRCIFSVNQEGRTALHLACMNNSHVIALLLIQHGALLNAPDAAGQTSMHLCSDPGMIHLLCQKGARTDIRDNHSFTPLYVHTLHCREELVQMLLSHNADPTLLDPLNLRNTLHCAAYMGNYNIISMLLSVPKINTFLDAQDIYGNTAIHIIVSNRLESLNSVCRNNSTHKVQSLLIQKCLMLLLNRGANVNIKNKFDETCLHFICSNIHLRETYSTAPILEIVVNMGGEVNVSDRDGCTPLMVGAVYGNWEVCELLVRGGGDLNSLFSITTSYLLNNRKEYYENNKKDRKSRSKDSKINYGDMGDNTDNNDNDDENLLYKTCVTSEIIPRQTLLSLYNHISAPQSMIKNNNFNERRCMGCREGFDSGAVNDKNSSFLSAFLGLEIEAQLTVGLKNCRPSGYNYYDKKKTGHGNNCGHCGRYLCPKCLNHELLVALLPEFLQTSILKSQGLRLSFLTHSGDNLKLCQLCYTILAVK